MKTLLITVKSQLVCKNVRRSCRQLVRYFVVLGYGFFVRNHRFSQVF